MNKIEPYKEGVEKPQAVNEPLVAYTSNKGNSDIVTRERDDIGCAISSKELLSRLRLRIKTLFE